MKPYLTQEEQEKLAWEQKLLKMSNEEREAILDPFQEKSAKIFRDASSSSESLEKWLAAFRGDPEMMPRALDLARQTVQLDSQIEEQERQREDFYFNRSQQSQAMDESIRQLEAQRSNLEMQKQMLLLEAEERAMQMQMQGAPPPASDPVQEAYEMGMPEEKISQAIKKGSRKAREEASKLAMMGKLANKVDPESLISTLRHLGPNPKLTNKIVTDALFDGLSGGVFGAAIGAIIGKRNGNNQKEKQEKARKGALVGAGLGVLTGLGGTALGISSFRDKIIDSAKKDLRVQIDLHNINIAAKALGMDAEEMANKYLKSLANLSATKANEEIKGKILRDHMDSLFKKQANIPLGIGNRISAWLNTAASYGLKPGTGKAMLKSIGEAALPTAALGAVGGALTKNENEGYLGAALKGGLVGASLGTLGAGVGKAIDLHGEAKALMEKNPKMTLGSAWSRVGHNYLNPEGRAMHLRELRGQGRSNIQAMREQAGQAQAGHLQAAQPSPAGTVAGNKSPFVRNATPNPAQANHLENFQMRTPEHSSVILPNTPPYPQVHTPQPQPSSRFSPYARVGRTPRRRSPPVGGNDGQVPPTHIQSAPEVPVPASPPRQVSGEWYEAPVTVPQPPQVPQVPQPRSTWDFYNEGRNAGLGRLDSFRYARSEVGSQGPTLTDAYRQSREAGFGRLDSIRNAFRAEAPPNIPFQSASTRPQVAAPTPQVPTPAPYIN